jgi:putative spermidine/putrescine transport system permease protein
MTDGSASTTGAVRRMGRRPLGLGLSGISVLVGIWLILPPLIVIPMSLTSAATFRFPPPGWSLQWYQSLVTMPQWRQSFLTSLEIATIVTIISTVLGTAAAIGLKRSQTKLSGAISNIVISPMVIPTVVAAVGIYYAALHLGVQGTIWAFVGAHTAIALPFVFIAVISSLESYDEKLDWAAATLGATRLTTFRQITFPLIRTGIVSGALFAFIASFDETVVALFLTGPKLHTLPVTMYEGILEITDPTVAAASSALFALSLVGLFAFLRVSYRGGKG